MPGTLYVVATPIGNLEDITLRALRVLREVGLIAAEDTRVTRKLLSRYDVHTALTSYNQHSRGEKTESLIERLIAGMDIAVVSDAGVPGISDPGAELVTKALERGAAVVPIPGPNAALSALVVSGLSTSRFVFEGFPPRSRSDRHAFFTELRSEPRTIVLYEAPSRIASTLQELYTGLGERPAAVARELTKLFEEVFRGTLSGAAEWARATKPRGELTIVVGGLPSALRTSDVNADQTEESRVLAIEVGLSAALNAGMSPRDAVRQVATTLDQPRRLVYATFLEMRRSQ